MVKAKVKDFVRNFFISNLRKKAKKCKSLNITGRTLIIAPHPDDEVLGCGGLIAQLVANGESPYIIILSGGEASHSGCCAIDANSIIQARRKLTRRALSMLKFPLEHLYEFYFPDGNILSVDDAEMDKLYSLIKKINPDNIMIPHHGEGWSDHLAAREIGMKLKSNKSVYEYCVWMWYYHQKDLDWKNGFILNFPNKCRDQKLDAISAYINSKAPCGNPWSGVLPEVFIKACSWENELYFKVR